ncbi:hypothetical protein FJT64_015101 [Amphibalanus amphitrite]|uniref:Uncharacterized protein n=1 Tax=Amphibalanus amphitrite TaxID=1232801 RepID=A0A6A4X3Z5_AMPAM|nr:hypothetical protein FJT64_015101 [Amphibalanus amphitrite]
MEEELRTAIRELAEKVSDIEASVRVIDARVSEPNAGRRHVAPTALSAAEAAEPSEKQEQPSFGASAYLQADFRAIRDSLSKVKLPQDLVVGDSRAGIGKADLARFQVIQKCARFQETALKILSSAQEADPVIDQLTTVTLAQLRFLQEEYTHLIVSNQFDDSTAQLFKTLQHNPATFTPGAVENLQRAVAIAGARQHSRQDSLSLSDGPVLVKEQATGVLFNEESQTWSWYTMASKTLGTYGAVLVVVTDLVMRALRLFNERLRPLSASTLPKNTEH